MNNILFKYKKLLKENANLKQQISLQEDKYTFVDEINVLRNFSFLTFNNPEVYSKFQFKLIKNTRSNSLEKFTLILLGITENVVNTIYVMPLDFTDSSSTIAEHNYENLNNMISYFYFELKSFIESKNINVEIEKAV